MAAVNAEIAECEALQRRLSERLGKRKMGLDAFDEANEPLVADLERLRAARDSLDGGNSDGPTTVQTRESVERDLDAGGVADKRTMLTNALGRDRLVIDPYNGLFRNGKKAFDKSRIRLEGTDAPTATA